MERSQSAQFVRLKQRHGHNSSKVLEESFEKQNRFNSIEPQNPSRNYMTHDRYTPQTFQQQPYNTINHHQLQCSDDISISSSSFEQLEAINTEYQTLEYNLQQLELKKKEQSGKEAQLVQMTKKLKIKANELYKKEEILKSKQLQVNEQDVFWQQKKEAIKQKESANKKQMEEQVGKIEAIETKMINLEQKQFQVQDLEKQLNKKIEEYSQKQKQLNEVLVSYNKEREDFDLYIINSKTTLKDKDKEQDRLNRKHSRERQREQIFTAQIGKSESSINQKEEQLSKQTLELEQRNKKLQKDKQWIREKQQELEIWKNELVKEEADVQAMRLQISRRRDIISKKEINVMEWAKRNQDERHKNEKEKSDLDHDRGKQIREELELNDRIKQQKRREFDGLAKKSKIVEGKKQLLKRIKDEEQSLNKECMKIESELRVMDVVIKNHMDLQENLELKMMGLELSEELWKKKWEEQQRTLHLERQKLDDWEQQIKLRENQLKGAKRGQRNGTRNKSISSKGSSTGNKIVSSSTKSLKFMNNNSSNKENWLINE